MMRSLSRLFVMLLVAVSLASPAYSAGIEADEMLDDPVLEARARELSKQIRCPICAGETISESNADISKELRLIIRKRLTQGADEDQIKQELVAGYGEAVLMAPPLNTRSVALYAAPFAFLLLGAGIVALWWRTSNKAVAPQEESA
ncbi:MAG: cytochrome c-type biogenesis protein CcmH [Alphaproteobacteria bacterium]